MKRFILGAVALAFLGCQQASEAPQQPPASPAVSQSEAESGQMLTGAQQADVQLDKQSYAPGEEIKITALATGLSDSAWVEIVPSEYSPGETSESDSEPLSRLSLASEGPLQLPAPLSPGNYEMRLRDEGDKNLATRSFQVLEDSSPTASPPAP